MELATNRASKVRFLILFFLLVAGLSLLIKLPAVDQWIITPYVEGITSIAGFISGIASGSVEASRTYLHHPDFSVNIKKGCDGIIATIILVSACIAFPSTWKMKVLGILSGYLLIFILNIARILLLFSLGVHGEMELFNLVHVYVAQFIVIVGAMVFWIYWAGKTRTVSAG